MTKMSMTLVSLIGMASFAIAQPAPPRPGGGSAKPGPGSAAPSAKPGAGSAAPTAQPGAKMEMPKPPAEIKEMAKMGGRWRCTGSGVGPDMKTEVKFQGTSNMKVDLDGWWLRSTMTATLGTGKTAFRMKMEGFTGYYPAEKKWRSVTVMNDGTMMVGTSDGLKDGKMSSTADIYSPMGPGMFRETMDMANPKAMKAFGEMSMDKGKTWTKVYEMTCKK